MIGSDLSKQRITLLSHRVALIGERVDLLVRRLQIVGELGDLAISHVKVVLGRIALVGHRVDLVTRRVAFLGHVVQVCIRRVQLILESLDLPLELGNLRLENGRIRRRWQYGSGTRETNLHPELAVHRMGEHSHDATVLALHVVMLIAEVTEAHDLGVAFGDRKHGDHSTSRHVGCATARKEVITAGRNVDVRHRVHDVNDVSFVGVLGAIPVGDLKELAITRCGGAENADAEGRTVIFGLEVIVEAVRMMEKDVSNGSSHGGCLFSLKDEVRWRWYYF